ncbi:MAG: helix-turn-helix domain-containing protein [Nanoarchaeota archaeon]
MNKLEEILVKVGLTKQEARVYKSLLELQESQTGQLCKNTKIASSNIYNVLDSLIKKGLVNYKIQNNVKTFLPSTPEILNDIFLEKQKSLDEERRELNKLIINMKTKGVQKMPFSNYKYFEGLNGVKSMWHEINHLMDKNSVNKYYTVGKGSFERLLASYENHHKLRKEKGVKCQMIFDEKNTTIARKRKNNITQIRFMQLKNEAEWGIIKDNLYIQYITGKTPRSFLIKDEIFSKTFEQVFDQLWKEAKLL